MKRRTVLAGVPAALLLGGCTDVLSGDEVTFEADTATVSEDARSDTGYEETRVEDQTIERNFDQVDQTVVVVNRIAEYSREVSLGPIGGELARFTVVSTPTVEVGPVGPLNPVDDMDDQEIAEMMQNEYEQIQNVEQVDERSVTVLGESVSISKFSAEAQTEGGESVDVFVHIGQTQSEEDFLLAVGVHPQDVDEEDNIDTLISAVQHPVSAGGSGESGGSGE